MARSRFGILTRLVAIALLLWAATDLAFPRLCAEDSAVTMQSSSATESGSTQQDDCFCCCHHVVPVSVDLTTSCLFFVDVLNTSVVGLPLDIPRPLFHPPLFL